MPGVTYSNETIKYYLFLLSPRVAFYTTFIENELILTPKFITLISKPNLCNKCVSTLQDQSNLVLAIPYRFRV